MRWGPVDFGCPKGNAMAHLAREEDAEVGKSDEGRLQQQQQQLTRRVEDGADAGRECRLL